MDLVGEPFDPVKFGGFEWMFEFDVVQASLGDWFIYPVLTYSMFIINFHFKIVYLVLGLFYLSINKCEDSD